MAHDPLRCNSMCDEKERVSEPDSPTNQDEKPEKGTKGDTSCGHARVERTSMSSPQKENRKGREER